MGRDWSPLFHRTLLCLLGRGPLPFKERDLDSFDSLKKNVSHTHKENTTQGNMSGWELLNEASSPVKFSCWRREYLISCEFKKLSCLNYERYRSTVPYPAILRSEVIPNSKLFRSHVLHNIPDRSEQSYTKAHSWFPPNVTNKDS